MFGYFTSGFIYLWVMFAFYASYVEEFVAINIWKIVLKITFCIDFIILPSYIGPQSYKTP